MTIFIAANNKHKITYRADQKCSLKSRNSQTRAQSIKNASLFTGQSQCHFPYTLCVFLQQAHLLSSAIFCLCSSSDSMASNTAAPISRYVNVPTMRLRVRTFCFFMMDLKMALCFWTKTRPAAAAAASRPNSRQQRSCRRGWPRSGERGQSGDLLLLLHLLTHGPADTRVCADGNSADRDDLVCGPPPPRLCTFYQCHSAVMV